MANDRRKSLLRVFRIRPGSSFKKHLRRTGKPSWIWYFLTAAFIFIIILSGSLFFGQKTIWDRQRRFTVVFQEYPDSPDSTSAVYVFSVEPRLNRAILLPIPGDVLLEAPYGYSTYPASSIFLLGELDKKRGGGKLLTKSIEGTLGIFVDGYYIRDGIQRLFPNSSTDIERIKRDELSIFRMLLSLFSINRPAIQLATNLSLRDIYRLWSSIRNLRPDQIELINLEAVGSLTDVTAADGTVQRQISLDQFDLITQGAFEDSLIREEYASIEVVNASGRELLAAKIARVLEHAGANVINKSTAKDNQSQACTMAAADFTNASWRSIENFLKRSFKCENLRQKGNPTGQSDIIVTVGEEFDQ